MSVRPPTSNYEEPTAPSEQAQIVPLRPLEETSRSQDMEGRALDFCLCGPFSYSLLSPALAIPSPSPAKGHSAQLTTISPWCWEMYTPAVTESGSLAFSLLQCQE